MGAWDKAGHPRGHDGKFIEVGQTVTLPGGVAGRVTAVHGGNVAAEAADGTHRVVPAHEITAAPKHSPLSDTEYQAHAAMVSRRIGDAVAGGRATDRTHTFDGKGEIWKPERARQHKEIVDAMMAKADRVPNEGKMVIAGGLGGAGKSTTLRDHAGVDTAKYLTLNPDDVKEEMARRGMIPHVHGLSPMEASPLVHEEASHITQLAAKRALAQNKNLMWDITMSSAGSASKRIEQARTHGYKHVKGVFVDIPAETSVTRALARHRRGMEKYRNGEGHGGRYVPPELIRKAAGSDLKSTNRQAFDQLKHRFDSWSVYDNSVHGRAPLHLESGGSH